MELRPRDTVTLLFIFVKHTQNTGTCKTCDLELESPLGTDYQRPPSRAPTRPGTAKALQPSSVELNRPKTQMGVDASRPGTTMSTGKH